jgi:hypothetical protein
MAHFAELDENNIVLRVVVIANDELKDQWGREREAIGAAFCKSLFGAETRWAQTSYNAKARGKFAGVGDIYDPARRIFLPPETE